MRHGYEKKQDRRIYHKTLPRTELAFHFFIYLVGTISSFFYLIDEAEVFFVF